MASATPRLMCNTCNKQTSSPRVLDCAHILCNRCFHHAVNEYVLHTRKPGTAQAPPTHVPCDVCKLISRIPDAGVPQGLVTAMAGVSIGPNVTSAHGTGVRNSKKCKLMWKNKDHPHVHDATFFGDGFIVYITYEEKDGVVQLDTFKLRVRDLEGNVADLPFPTFLNAPRAVYGSPDGTHLAIIDESGGKRHIIVYSKTSRGWSNRKITTTESVRRVVMLPTGECVCTAAVTATSGNVMMYNTEGEKVWTKDLPHLAPGATRYPVLLSTTPSGLIIMCDLNTDKVTVMDSSGQPLHVFPTEFIKEPLDTCTDSQGDVLVYDWANRTVSLFCVDGTFVKKLLTHDVGFGLLSVFRDQYMLGCNNVDGLYLYKI